MKIAQIAPIVESIPPKKYGGTERVVDALTEELVRRGHEVTLFATGDSVTSANLVSVIPKGLREMKIKDLYGTNSWTMLHMGLAYQMQDQFDIIHDHISEMSTPTANIADTPVVMTLHGAINQTNKYLYEEMKNNNFVTISNAQAKPAPRLNYAGNVYHGLNMDHYPFSNQDEGYLLNVGRISEEKGTHYAIEVAEKLNLPLIIAAKLDPHNVHDHEYFAKYVKPHLKGKIKWIGEVNEEERNKLMSRALVSLHPVTWPEPFGLTLIEAMACGAPVVAFNQGSIPEVITDGVGGFVVTNVEEMIAAVKKIKTLSRKRVREYCLEKFSVKNMVDGYEKIYKELISKKYYRENFIFTQGTFLANDILQKQQRARKQFPNSVYAQDIKYRYRK